MSASSRGFAIVTILSCMASLQVIGAELRPYPFPSQQAEPRVEQRPMEQKSVRPQISEAYYQDFEQQTRDLNPAQRAELIKSFELRRDQAIEGGRVDEAQYYLRLLQILGKKR